MLNINELQNIANLLRRDSIISTTEAKSGHPSSCLSCAEIMSVLFFSKMQYDIKNPENPDNDEFILSKGHAVPILYSSLNRANCIKYNIKSLRKKSSSLEGHPIPNKLKWIKIATGSLGQGLSAGVGMALAAKLQARKYKTYVLLGDSELAEGQIYEAAQIATKYHLNNLIAIADINRLGQTGETMIGHNLEIYKKRFESFGWNAQIIDGHSIAQILNTLNKIQNTERPTIILAKTLKGKGVSFMENKEGWHGKPVPKTYLLDALNEIPNPKMPSFKIIKPTKIKDYSKKSNYEHPFFTTTDLISTREAYGKALAQLSKSNDKIITLDAEVSNSTYSNEIKKVRPFQFIECYIAEQNMISMALGMSKKGLNVFASTFASFLSRSYDQLRMASLSKPNLTICGSHSGVSIGEDGPSQMGLEDIAMFRTLPESIILYPSDAISTIKLLNLCSKTNSLKYIRTTRDKTPLIYSYKDEFKLNDFKILKESKKDKAVLIGAGTTLHESIKAHNILKNKNIDTAVIDLYCIKPLNTKKLISFVKKHGNKIILTEDHRKEGGIGESIAESLINTGIEFKHLYVSGIPHSATPQEQLELHKIDSKAIVSSFNKII
jgi:transketolase